jgi:hypothetical protein
MHIKDYLIHPENEDKKIQNQRLLKIVRRNANRTYNKYEKH